MKNTNSISIKTLITTFLFISILPFSFFCSGQTIHTADNNPGAIGGVNIYTGATALTDAIAAATAGDIIHVVRGANDYGATIVDKQLSIFGIGLNPDTDGGSRSVVSTLTIADPVASGTRISGLWITTILNLGGTAGALSNLLIENSIIFRIDHVSASTSLSSVIIRNNLLGAGNTATEEAISLLPGVISSVVIANNVIMEPSTPAHGNGAIIVSNGTSIENNLFIGAPSTVLGAFEGVTNCSIKNNIFYGVKPSANVSGSTFENNISFNTGNSTTDMFPTVGGNVSIGNIESVDPQLVDVNFSFSVNLATFDPSLIGGSPAENAGEDGTDMGVFGGGSPMTLEGTLIPTIQTVTLPSIVVKGDNLPVQIKAKGN